ncbi:hypothetical protein Riv7116_1248 [Rivularia sp. PCC 7116]|uniref:hypothetical protein n=1 Tax=Rivularia sp. PCC 7116 TaxID=373994 RepID=UPI00029ED350|nr:hypothetical protein [Rivularia sp. PCC 7116]AFY53817.1 hypothetical protein Riv7116_1248 [Rivularia sp. PCC 7116]
MIFFNSELARRKALKSALVSSILLFNMKSSLANQQVDKDSKNIDKPSQSSIQLDKNKVCPSANLLPIRSFNTAKYYVYICRGDNKNLLGYYVRIPKNLDNKITVPIAKKARETYIAINGELAYIITPYEMLITKRGKIILREKVISAVQADGKPLAKGCPEGNNTFARAETKSFFIYICGMGNPSSYVSVTRKSNRRINLPLKKWNQNSKQNGRYVAINGNIRFILTNKVLRVSRGERNVIKEKVLRWE